jgi:hypothetical protein
MTRHAHFTIEFAGAFIHVFTIQRPHLAPQDILLKETYQSHEIQALRRKHLLHIDLNLLLHLPMFCVHLSYMLIPFNTPVILSSRALRASDSCIRAAKSFVGEALLCWFERIF